MQFNDKITPDERWILSLILLVAITSFILLTLCVRNGYLAQFDHTVLTWFHKIKNPSLDHFFSTVTWIGSLWILLPLYLVLVLSLSRYLESFEKLMAIGFWGTFITTYALKFALERKRPHFFYTINEVPIDPSYPSAHTAQIVAFTLLLLLVGYPVSSLIGQLFTAVLISLALAVCISRMYLQVHFPTDIIAGALIAIVWVCITLLVVKSGALP